MQVRDSEGADFFFGKPTKEDIEDAARNLGHNFGHHSDGQIFRFLDHLKSHETPFHDKGLVAAVRVREVKYGSRTTYGILCYKLVPYDDYIKCYINSLAVDRHYKGDLNIATMLIRKLVSYLHAEFGIEKICNVTIVVEDEGQAPVGFYKAAGFKKTSAIYEADALELNWRALLGRDGGHWEELSGELNSLRNEEFSNGKPT
jgi:ribosomal protein S18 acetylase RimI-like enzyme